MPRIDVFGDRTQKVALASPFYGGQAPDWWTQIVAEVYRLDKYRPLGGPNLQFHSVIAVRGTAVQNQRNAIVHWFRESDADWIWFLDTDTIPPRSAAGQLFRTGNTIVSGLYWHGEEDKGLAPLVYFRRDDGLYVDALQKYGRDVFIGMVGNRSIIEADAAGAGMLLVHRSVFDDIEASHTVVRFPWTGGASPIPNRLLKGTIPNQPKHRGEPVVKNGLLRMPVMKWVPQGGEHWPFFIEEYGRTEDLAFYEMAKEAGHQLYIDLGVEAEHKKSKKITHKDYVILESDE